MSRKKRYETVGMHEEVWAFVDRECALEERPRGYIIERVLRSHYDLPMQKDQKEESHVSTPR